MPRLSTQHVCVRVAAKKENAKEASKEEKLVEMRTSKQTRRRQDAIKRRLGRNSPPSTASQVRSGAMRWYGGETEQSSQVLGSTSEPMRDCCQRLLREVLQLPARCKSREQKGVDPRNSEGVRVGSRLDVSTLEQGVKKPGVAGS
jgi:hypothetical protein